jgi:hypothetical protein
MDGDLRRCSTNVQKALAVVAAGSRPPASPNRGLKHNASNVSKSPGVRAGHSTYPFNADKAVRSAMRTAGPGISVDMHPCSTPKKQTTLIQAFGKMNASSPTLPCSPELHRQPTAERTPGRPKSAVETSQTARYAQETEKGSQHEAADNIVDLVSDSEDDSADDASSSDMSDDDAPPGQTGAAEEPIAATAGTVVRDANHSRENVCEHDVEKNINDMSQPGLCEENPTHTHQKNDSHANVVVTLLSSDDDEPLPQQAAEVHAAGNCQRETCGGNLADGHPSVPQQQFDRDRASHKKPLCTGCAAERKEQHVAQDVLTGEGQTTPLRDRQEQVAQQGRSEGFCNGAGPSRGTTLASTSGGGRVFRTPSAAQEHQNRIDIAFAQLAGQGDEEMRDCDAASVPERTAAPEKGSAHLPATACNGEGEGEHMRTELAEIVQALSGVDYKAQSIKANGSKGNGMPTVKREKQKQSKKSKNPHAAAVCPFR